MSIAAQSPGAFHEERRETPAITRLLGLETWDLLTSNNLYCSRSNRVLTVGAIEVGLYMLDTVPYQNLSGTRHGRSRP